MSYHEDYSYNFGMYDKMPRESQIQNKIPILRLEGTGTVRTLPDVASVFLGVVTENKDLSVAQKENSLTMDKVIASILRLGIAEKYIKTESYSITPQYDFIEGKQIFRGYKINNNLKVTINNIRQVGEVIDTAVESGANAIYNINFSILNKEAVYKKALSLAIKDAVDKANSVENTLRIQVDEIPIEIVEEGSTGNIERTDLYNFKSPAPSTDIRSGELEVTAKVQAIFNYRKI